MTFWLALLASSEIGIFGIVTGNLSLNISPEAWIYEAILALTATVMALVLFQKGLCLCGEIKASLFSAFEPITGVAIGILLLGETAGLKELIGIGCILFAAVLLALKKPKN